MSDTARTLWIEPDLRPIADSADASTQEFLQILDVLAEQS